MLEISKFFMAIGMMLSGYEASTDPAGGAPGTPLLSMTKDLFFRMDMGNMLL